MDENKLQTPWGPSTLHWQLEIWEFDQQKVRPNWSEPQRDQDQLPSLGGSSKPKPSNQCNGPNGPRSIQIDSNWISLSPHLLMWNATSQGQQRAMGQKLLRGDQKGLENPKLPEVGFHPVSFLCCPFQIFFSNFLTFEKILRFWRWKSLKLFPTSLALRLLYAIWITSVNIILILSWSNSQEVKSDDIHDALICAMVKSRYIGDGHPTFNRNPYNGYINPYYWVDDHPLLYGNNGSLNTGTFMFNCIRLWRKIVGTSVGYYKGAVLSGSSAPKRSPSKQRMYAPMPDFGKKRQKGNNMFREDCLHEHVIIKSHLIFHILILLANPLLIK